MENKENSFNLLRKELLEADFNRLKYVIDPSMPYNVIYHSTNTAHMYVSPKTYNLLKKEFLNGR